MVIPPDPPKRDPEPEPAPAERRRFTRSSEDKVIGGVCGGLGRALGIDPLILRVAAVALLFVGGIAAIAYVAAIVFVPEDGDPATARTAPSRVATAVGVTVLIVAGFAALDDFNFGIDWGWWVGPLIPLALIAGLLLAAGRQLLRDRGETAPPWTRIVGVGFLLVAGTVAAGALAAASAWATAAGGGEVVAAVVIALGAGMVIASFRGGARWLALPALILALPAGVVAAADIDVDGGMGERSYHPVKLADVDRGGYRLGVGELKIDLRDLDWPSGGAVNVALDLGVGHAVVLVPEDVCVRATGDAGVGYVDVLGEDAAGIDVRHAAGSVTPSRTPSLVLDAEIGMGAIEVRHDEAGRGRPGHSPSRISEALAAAGCGGRT